MQRVWGGWVGEVTRKPGTEPRQFLILLPASAEQWKVLQMGKHTQLSFPVLYVTVFVLVK